MDVIPLRYAAAATRHSVVWARTNAVVTIAIHHPIRVNGQL